MMLRKLGAACLRANAPKGRALHVTALNELHKELGGKMVPFAGYELPVQYSGEKGGVKAEHLHCRNENGAALFDVGHMGQIYWYGADRLEFVEKMVVGDIAGLGAGEGRLSLITNEDGGIIDDTVISNKGDSLYMVVNGACKYGDMEHFDKYLAEFTGDCTYEYHHTQNLVALQGPASAAVLQRLVGDQIDLTRMAFMTTTEATIAGAECGVTRCGYTGEDGFEISIPEAHAVTVATALLEQSEVEPAGLGARDSLRLEAGLCLYGNDIDGTTTPTEAALTWTIGGPKSRRRKEQGFTGAEKFLTPEGKIKATTRKRVGIAGHKSPARAGTEVFSADGETKIGELTSGTFGPSLDAPCAMGYVAKDHSKDGTDVMLNVRGKMQAATITKMPFVESRYYRVPE
eukprot:CAMPEP_0118881804 /NCGR_PEP_ID=MMETSP1163-20130328/21180_1 /TAXON_ID=124430 /ORGANISM="Phaeomonas parva, Strain CCMP2877" /LENGTH=401 /DNA_ID=CAMNT_0006818673 /DNA_START=42 /DNA_END=1247 /DNA_ORIENTATION=+